MKSKFSEEQYVINAVANATVAANIAGEEWLKEHQSPAFEVVDHFTGRRVGTMLDICGNAHVKVADKRSKFYKILRRLNMVDSQTGVVSIIHRFRGRQEYGLQVAAAHAAYNYLTEAGYSCKIWSYVD